jgi:hypothetical protein
MKPNYIYLLQEREFIKTNEQIYKIGKTKQINNKRLNQYPKGSILLFQIICDNCDYVEKYLINIFKKKYKHCIDIGNEYFEGFYKEMIEIIYQNIKNNEDKIENIKNNEDKNDNNIELYDDYVKNNY